MSGPITLDMALDAVRHVLELRDAVVPLSESTRFDELSLDSLDQAELMLALERRAECELDPASAVEVETLGDLVKVRAVASC